MHVCITVCLSVIPQKKTVADHSFLFAREGFIACAIFFCCLIGTVQYWQPETERTKNVCHIFSISCTWTNTACTTTDSIQPLAYPRISRPPHKKLKVYLCWGQRQKCLLLVWKQERSPGVENIPSELLQNGGEAITTVLTAICQMIWEMKKWLKDWAHSFIVPLPKKSSLKQCQNYRTISLISHPSKIMLGVILSQLEAKA